MAKHKVHWLTKRPNKWGVNVYCGRWLDRWYPKPLEERTVSKLTRGDLEQVTCERCLKLMRESRG